MSESHAVYRVQGGLPETLLAFRSRPCSFPYAGGEYVPPSPEEVARLVELAGWSQSQVARLAGVSFNRRGSTTVRKWKTPTGSAEHRVIPYATWRHLLCCAGVVSCGEDVAALDSGVGASVGR